MSTLAILPSFGFGTDAFTGSPTGLQTGSRNWLPDSSPDWLSGWSPNWVAHLSHRLFANNTPASPDLGSTTASPKGVGGAGIGRYQQVGFYKPLPLTVTSGKITALKTEPCTGRTGTTPIGTHLMVTTDDKQNLNYHVGPASIVLPLLKDVPLNQPVTFKVFRTDDLASNHWILQSLTYSDKETKLPKTITFRDETVLKPIWAPGRHRGDTFERSRPLNFLQ